MDAGLNHLHNFMRWLVLLFAVLTLVKGMGGMNGSKKFTASDKRMALFLMISCDIQLVIGLGLYFMKGWWSALASGVGMTDAYRFFSVEHIFGMLVAIVLIHIGYAATKKDSPDGTKFKKMFWFTLVAVLIILGTIPWNRPLFPGMH